MEKMTITGVALKNADGTMIALPRPCRHHHLFALAAFQGWDFMEAEQGFTTCSGDFVGRVTARSIVEFSGQPNRKSGDQSSNELFSEDVW